MKTTNLFWMAGRFTFAAFSILFLIGIAAGSYCWCAGGGLAAGVQEQLSKTYELYALPTSSIITGELVPEIQQIEGVAAASVTKDLTAVLQSGDHSAEMTLEGIGVGYLQEEISEGTVFPDETVMPYIILNKAGWDLLQDKDENGETIQGTDWSESSVSILAGTESYAIAAKICGIMDDGKEDPKAYVSISSTKMLAGDSSFTGYVARARETRYAKSVSEKLAALGLDVQNTVPVEQSDWDGKNKEAGYLMLLGSAVIFYSVFLYLNLENPMHTKNRYKLEMLRSIGLCASDLLKIFLLKSIFLFCTGFAFGLVCYALIPQMIAPEASTQINIAYPVGTSGLLAGAVANMAASLIAVKVQSRRIKKLCV